MRNKRIKKAMLDAGMNQKQLAELLQIPMSEMSVMLNNWELAVKEQNEIVKRIREHTAIGG